MIWNEAIRKRPGMYLGRVGNRGLSEVLKGAATDAYERLGSNDFVIEIIDDLSLKITINQIKEQVQDDWGKGFGNSNNLFWVELWALNALSTKCTICFFDIKNALIKEQTFKDGYLTKGTIDQTFLQPKKISATFHLDSTVWETGFFIHKEYLIQSIKEFAYLRKNQRFEIKYTTEEQACRVIYHFKNGLKERLALETLHKYHYTYFDTYLDKKLENCAVEIAFAFRPYSINACFLKSHVNDYHSYQNGSHVEGLLTGLTKGITRYLEKQDLKDYKVTNALVAEELIAVLNVQLKTPHFTGSTKNNIHNPEIIKPIAVLVADAIFEAMKTDKDKAMSFLRSFKVWE